MNRKRCGGHKGNGGDSGEKHGGNNDPGRGMGTSTYIVLQVNRSRKNSHDGTRSIQPRFRK